MTRPRSRFPGRRPVALCNACNREKRNLTLEEYRARKGGGLFFGERCESRRPEKSADARWENGGGPAMGESGTNTPRTSLAAPFPTGEFALS